MAARRDALIIATGTYEDDGLRRLRSPAQDAAALGRVLGDSTIGGFEVKQLIDQDEAAMRLAIFEFFDQRGLDDLLLLHLSCHGIKDDDGRLYFAATNTRRETLEVTAMPSAFLNEWMERSRARSIILLLDCCYAGAFAQGSKGDEGVHLREKFDGSGRAILTASNAIEYSFEGDNLSGAGRPSVFTAAIVEGLKTGKADRDGDGRVSIPELHDFVNERMLEAKPKQTPLKWELGIEGGLYIARSPRPSPPPEPPPPPSPLPLEIDAALTHPLASVRAAVVADLARLLHSGDARAARAARKAIEGLLDDDSSMVRQAACDALPMPPPRPPPQLPPIPGFLAGLRAALAGRPAVSSAVVIVLGTVAALLVLDRDDNAGGGGDEAEFTAKVPATQPWTDTTIDLGAGDEITITANGEVIDDINNHPDRTFTPDGEPDLEGEHSGDPHRDINHAALIGKVGDGEAFFVGSDHAFTAADAGRLHLGINDGRFDDNAGAYDAVVTVTGGAVSQDG